MKHLDANVIIHYLRGDPSIVARLHAELRGSVAISAIAAHELRYGGLRTGKTRRSKLDKVLNELIVVAFDESAASESARIRFELETRGERIGPMDLLIAGTALAHGAILVTNNSREFQRVPGLRVEDWRTSQDLPRRRDRE